MLAQRGVVLSKLITDNTALDSEVGGFYPIASAKKDNSLDSIDMPWPIIGCRAEVTDDAVAFQARCHCTQMIRLACSLTELASNCVGRKRLLSVVKTDML